MVVQMFALILAVVQASVADIKPIDEAAYLQKVRAEVRACGITANPQRLEYEALYQDYALAFDDPDLKEVQVECLANSPVLDGLIFEFANTQFHEVYERTRMARPDVRAAYEESLARIRHELDARGLLAGAPKPLEGQRLSVFAIALEKHCGLPPGALLQVDDETGQAALVGDGVATFEQMSCVIGLMMLAGQELDPAMTISIAGEDQPDR